jgi:AraC-like DNA-binding protein
MALKTTEKLAELTGACTLIGFWRFRIHAGHQGRAQSTDGHLIHLVTEGGYRLGLGGASFAVEAGMAIWYHEREAVTWTGDRRNVEFLSCGFLLPTLPAPPLQERVWHADTTLKHAFTQALAATESEATSLGRSLRATAGAANVAACICARADFSADKLWSQAETCLSRHHGPWDLGQIATRLHVSASTLHRACLAERGISPGQRLRELRMDYARHLLQQTPLDIGTISQQLHYTSAQSFARAFRQHFGSAPLAWRNHTQGA